MKRFPMPTSCPVTGEPLEVTRLENPNSGIIIEGRFIPNEFALLSPEHSELLRLFLLIRGNLKATSGGELPNREIAHGKSF